jgi:hypothetical protein
MLLKFSEELQANLKFRNESMVIVHANYLKGDTDDVIYYFDISVVDT